MRIVEHGAEHPFLPSRVPIGPRVAADFVRAAPTADHCVALAAVWHAVSLPLPSRRSNRWQDGIGPKWWKKRCGGMLDSTRDPVFTRQELIDAELDRIVSETGSEGATPH